MNQTGGTGGVSTAPEGAQIFRTSNLTINQVRFVNDLTTGLSLASGWSRIATRTIEGPFIFADNVIGLWFKVFRGATQVNRRFAPVYPVGDTSSPANAVTFRLRLPDNTGGSFTQSFTVSLTRRGFNTPPRTRIVFSSVNYPSSNQFATNLQIEMRLAISGAGARGAVGPAGQKGDTGDTGPAGQKGDTGDTGPAGQKGDTGDTGPAGQKGDTGDTGPAGQKGDTGDTGPAGQKGDPGQGVASGGTTGQVLTKKTNTDYDTEWTNKGSGGGSSTFVGLTDTPSAFTGEGGKVVKVNTGATALEFDDAGITQTAGDARYIRLDRGTLSINTTGAFTPAAANTADRAITRTEYESHSIIRIQNRGITGVSETNPYIVTLPTQGVIGLGIYLVLFPGTTPFHLRIMTDRRMTSNGRTYNSPNNVVNLSTRKSGFLFCPRVNEVNFIPNDIAIQQEGDARYVKTERPFLQQIIEGAFTRGALNTADLAITSDQYRQSSALVMTNIGTGTTALDPYIITLPSAGNIGITNYIAIINRSPMTMYVRLMTDQSLRGSTGRDFNTLVNVVNMTIPAGAVGAGYAIILAPDRVNLIPEAQTFLNDYVRGLLDYDAPKAIPTRTLDILVRETVPAIPQFTAIAAQNISLGTGSWVGGSGGASTVWFITGGNARAFRVANRARDTAKDITLPTGTTFVGGLTAGSTMWFIGSGLDENTLSPVTNAYAYNNVTGARDASKDITLENITYTGGVSDGNTLWFITGTSARAYSASTRVRLTGNDITLPAGTWTGGTSPKSTFIWFLNSTTRTAVAYRRDTRVADSRQNFSLGTSGDLQGMVVVRNQYFWVVNNTTNVAQAYAAVRIPPSTVQRTLDRATMRTWLGIT